MITQTRCAVDRGVDQHQLAEAAARPVTTIVPSGQRSLARGATA